jgi:hypothetical protein
LNNRIPFTQGWFLPSLIEIGQLVHMNMVLPFVAPPDPRGPWCDQCWIYIVSESFHVDMTYIGSVGLENIFKWPHQFLHTRWKGMAMTLRFSVRPSHSW